ncbi:MAG: hypothetical protein ACLGIE_06540 [Alphaproteobacteria bacterium]
MRHLATISLLALGLAGCGEVTGGNREPVTGPSAPQPATEVAPAVGATALGARAVSAAALDTTTAEQKAAALSAPAATGERSLGKVVVALGPPAEQGLWLSTALVDAPVQGRIETAGGKSLTLELRPGTGGALLSLAAYQALGLSLTQLPEVTVYAR